MISFKFIALFICRLRYFFHFAATIYGFYFNRAVSIFQELIYLDIIECPYECIVNDVGSVRARGDALTRAQRGKTARFEVSMWNVGRGELDVLISGRAYFGFLFCESFSSISPLFLLSKMLRTANVFFLQHSLIANLDKIF